jgi:hypothetical protein
MFINCLFLFLNSLKHLKCCNNLLEAFIYLLNFLNGSCCIFQLAILFFCAILLTWEILFIFFCVNYYWSLKFVFLFFISKMKLAKFLNWFLIRVFMSWFQYHIIYDELFLIIHSYLLRAIVEDGLIDGNDMNEGLPIITFI